MASRERKRSKVVGPRHWEYRIVKRRLAWPNGDPYDWYGIHECYFRDGKLDAITADAATIEGETQQEITEIRVMMFQAIKSAVIDYDAFVATFAEADHV